MIKTPFENTSNSQANALVELLKKAINPMTYIGGLARAFMWLAVTAPSRVAGWILNAIAMAYSLLMQPARQYGNKGKFNPLKLMLVLEKLVTWVANAAVTKGRYNPLRFIGQRRSVADLLREKFQDSQDPLLADRLDEARERRYPREDNEDLYMSLRSDMDPGVIVESRLIDGSHVKNLSFAYVTDKLVNECFEAGRKYGFKAFTSTMFALTLLFSVIYLPMMTETIAYVDRVDAWDRGFFATIWSYAGIGIAYASAIVVGLLLNPFFYMTALGQGFADWSKRTAVSMRIVMSQVSVPFLRSTKQSKIGAKYNAAERQIERESFKKTAKKNESYLKKVGFDRSVKIGTATGEFRARGMSTYASPMPGQEVRFDLEAFTKGVAVIGQTGSGKTSNVLLPIFRSLLSQKKRGFFIMDGKAVLWEDCENIVQKYYPERMKDLVVIGTGSYNGKRNFGVDLLKGMSPSQVAEVARSVMEQLSSSVGGDDYWPTAGAQLVEHAARMARAYSLTDEGIKEAKDRGQSAYSLMFIYDLIKKTELRENIGQIIASNLKKGPRSKSASVLYSEDYRALMNSLRFMCRKGTKSEADTFASMSDGQKSGVIGAVDKLLGSLYGHKELRQRFAEGRLSNTIDVAEALHHKIVAVNISTEETGNAGAFIMTMMKTRLYAMSLLRQRAFKLQGRNPQHEAPVTFLGDEAQLFVSSSKSIGLDEGNALNVLRSTGLSVIFGFQGFSSIYKRLGRDITNDLLAQLTNKIILTNSDEATADWISKNSGQTMRMRAHRENEHENVWQSFSEHGQPLTPDEVDQALANNPDLVNPSFVGAGAIKDPFELNEVNPYTPNDQVWNLIGKISTPQKTTGNPIVDFLGPKKHDESARAQAMISELNRREDKEEAYITSGNEIRPVVSPSEISSLPEGKAWVTWSQAGLVRTDLVNLDEAIH